MLHDAELTVTASGHPRAAAMHRQCRRRRTLEAAGRRNGGIRGRHRRLDPPVTDPASLTRACPAVGVPDPGW